MREEGTTNGRSIAILSPVERRRRNRDEMITAILDASRDVMREEGAAALNLNEVARRVGVRTPSLYTYFSSKAQLYDALFLLGIELFAERIRNALSEPLPLWERIKVSFETYMNFAHESPELYRLVFERPVPGFTPSQRSMEASWSLLAWGNAQIEEACRAEGITPPIRFNQVTDLILALQHGLTSLHVANEPDLPPGAGRFGALIPAAVELLKSAWGTELTAPTEDLKEE